MLLLACSLGPDLSPELEEARASLEAWQEAVTLQEQGEASAALEKLERALEIRSNSPELWLSKAHFLADSGRFDEAVTAATRALRLRPEWPEAYFDRACFESRAGRFRQAAADIQVALNAGGSFRLLAAAEADLDPLREQAEYADLLPEKALPADVESDGLSYFLGSEWSLVFRFLNRPESPVVLELEEAQRFPGRHVRTVEDIWPDDDVNAHELRVTYRVLGQGEGTLGPWTISASGLQRELGEAPFLFRQPPGLGDVETQSVGSVDFVVPSTRFRGHALNSPLREGERVWVRTLPGDRVEWATPQVVEHEYREKGQTQWLGWEAVLPPNSEITIRRGKQKLWSGTI